MQKNRVYGRPKTVQQLEDEGAVEDDGYTDVEYELKVMSKESLVVESERHGFCLIFVPKESCLLTHEIPVTGDSPFVLEQVAFFAKGVQIYQGYQGEVIAGIGVDHFRNSETYQRLGVPFATRTVHETLTDLFVLDDLIVNVGFQEGDQPQIAHIHVRRHNRFDAVMLAPVYQLERGNYVDMPGLTEIGLPADSPEVQGLLARFGLQDEIDEEEGCPDEISRLAVSQGLIFYFRDVSTNIAKREFLQRHLSAMTYKRRGDLDSLGYGGALPFGFDFGDRPSVLIEKAGAPPLNLIESEQLASYVWRLESNHLVQAVFSLIDWQLARVTVHAPFNADYMLAH